MKKQLYLLCFITLFTGVSKVFAQTTQTPDSSMVSGHFEINVVAGGDTNHINVNYALSPAPFTTNMNLELNTPDAMLFDVDIRDESGSVMASWSPTASSNYYNHDIDISSLPGGNYYVNIRKESNGAIFYSVPFTK